MLEGRIGGRPVPVLEAGRDVDDVAGPELTSGLAPGLVPTPAADDDEWMCQLLRQPGSPLPHFITDAPSFSAPVPGRVIVPIRDAAAHATFYLLVRTDCRQEAENLFDWVSRQ